MVELENIIVKEISAELKTKTGAPFWAVTLTDGRKATVWDAGIADTIRANLNVSCKAFLKAQGSFLNIRDFQGGNTTMTSTNPTIPQETLGSVAAPSVDEMHPVDEHSINAKSSVKLIKNSRGLNWEVKVVAGEEGLVPGLTACAIAQHKALCTEFPVVE